MIKLTLSFQRK